MKKIFFESIVISFILIFYLFSAASNVEAAYYYPGDLTGKFTETEVLHLTSPSQVAKYVTTDLKNPQTGPLPPTINFSGTGVTFTDKSYIGIDNPLKNEPFYKIEVTINDTNQQNLISYLTLIDTWWSATTFTNGISVGLNTDETKSSYWYWHTLFKNQGQIPDAEYNFSKQALARFSKRITGDTKLELYVTPIGIYAVVNGANFASFPDLYIGPYLFKFTSPINYVVLGKHNIGGDPVTFKDLKITKLDNTVSSVDDVNAYFIKRTVESDAFTNLISNSASMNGTNGFQNALWAAFLYRAYDYYFKPPTDHQTLVQHYIDDYYIPTLTTYVNDQLPRYAKERTVTVNHSFINSIQWNTYGVYAISDYLTQNEKSLLQQQFARVIDTSENYIKADSSNTDNFPAPMVYIPKDINQEHSTYKGDTFAEETDWLLSLYTGYYLNFPNDTPRSDKLLDYIAFLGFVSMSDGKSINQVYGSSYNFKYLGDEYKNFVTQYIWPDGNVDNHQFHPSVNYGQGVVGQSAVAIDGLSKVGVTLAPISNNLDKIYNTIIKGNVNISDFHLLHSNPSFDSTNTNLSTGEDVYNYAADGSINYFRGYTSPSLVEDWANVYTNYHIVENYGDYPMATQFAKNVYYGFYSGSGKLFCSAPSPCDVGTSNFYNYLFGDPLYAMLFSKRSQFKSKPGDFNYDGNVDLNDFNTIKTHFGNPYTLFNYNDMVSNFGT